MTDHEQTIEAALAYVHDARVILKDVEAECESANRRLNNAVNLVNNAEKAFDEACLKLRKTAPRRSDWSRVNTKSFPAE